MDVIKIWCQIYPLIIAEDNTCDIIASGGIKELLRISRESPRDDARNLAKKALDSNSAFLREVQWVFSWYHHDQEVKLSLWSCSWEYEFLWYDVLAIAILTSRVPLLTSTHNKGKKIVLVDGQMLGSYKLALQFLLSNKGKKIVLLDYAPATLNTTAKFVSYDGLFYDGHLDALLRHAYPTHGIRSVTKKIIN